MSPSVAPRAPSLAPSTSQRAARVGDGVSLSHGAAPLGRRLPVACVQGFSREMLSGGGDARFQKAQGHMGERSILRMAGFPNGLPPGAQPCAGE